MKLISLWHGLAFLFLTVLFLAAFDMVSDYSSALEAVVNIGCERLLTSGLEPTALEGLETLKKLVLQVRYSANHLILYSAPRLFKALKKVL